MNDGQWLKHWCAQNIEAAPESEQGTADDLAERAARDAARDGFSVDRAVAEGGYPSLLACITTALEARDKSRLA